MHWSLPSVRVRVGVRVRIRWYLLTCIKQAGCSHWEPPTGRTETHPYTTLRLVVRTNLFGYFSAALFFVIIEHSRQHPGQQAAAAERQRRQRPPPPPLPPLPTSDEQEQHLLVGSDGRGGSVDGGFCCSVNI